MKIDFQPKLFEGLRHYSREKFIADLMAGIIVGIVALPLAIAFGIASGVTPEKGLITAIVGGFIVSALGGSSVQIGGPTGAFIVIVFGIIQGYGLEGLAIATAMAGALLVLMGLFRLGGIIKFIPYPIVVGFTSGIALTIFTTQIKDLLGLTVDKLPADCLSQWAVYFQHLDSINPISLLIGVGSILIIAVMPKISRKIPGSLVAIIVMTAVATLLAYVIGLPIGVLLITSAKKGIRPNAPLNTVLGWIVNIVRSVPFIILLVAIIPLTRLIVGTSLGVPGAIVPLVITAAPFVARVVEQSLAEVDGSLVEAAQSFGASNLQIVFKVLLFESLPSLVRGAALTFITLFGFSAMAGTVGAGGLGDIAIRYGYQRYQYDVMTVAVILCVILVQIVQTIGDVVSDHIDHHER